MSRPLTVKEIAKLDFANDERLKIHDSDSDDIKQKKLELMKMQQVLIAKQRMREEMETAIADMEKEQRECQLEIQRLEQEDHRLSQMLQWTEMEIQWNKEHPNAIDYIP